MSTMVGIDRKIKRAWLDAVLDRLTQTTDEQELRAFVEGQLQQELPGKASRAKTTAIILRIWSSIPAERLPLRDRALALLPRISGQERIWLHWGMTALAYPFFRDTAEVVGRLLALQDDFTSAQVQSRMLTTWGDRATTREAAQKMMPTLVDWEVLRSTKTRGHFLLARKMTASIPDLQLWLLEALLAASVADEIEVQQLLRLPESFPFTLGVGVSDIRRHERFDLHRQGLDMDMVALRKVKPPPPPAPIPKPKRETAGPRVQGRLFDLSAGDGEGRQDQRKPASRGKASGSSRTPGQGSSSERKQVEELLLREFRATLPARAARYLEMQREPVVGSAPFAAECQECVALFRDGHFRGCLVLTKSVVEAMIGHLWQVKLGKPNLPGSFDKQLAALQRKKILGDEWKGKLAEVMTERPVICTWPAHGDVEQPDLEGQARRGLTVLHELERELFGVMVEGETGGAEQAD